MGNSLVKAAALDFGIQWVCWAFAAALQTEKFYDLAGSGTFVILTLVTLNENVTAHIRQKVNSGMVVTYALRLGIYLFSRILKDGGDRRFNVVRTKPGLFWVYWTIQGVWILSTLLPTLIVNTKKDNSRLQTRDYIGWSLWGLGFLMEMVADFQKSQFRSDPQNAVSTLIMDLISPICNKNRPFLLAPFIPQWWSFIPQWWSFIPQWWSFIPQWWSFIPQWWSFIPQW
ncbi:unnamed protein product [Candidula unifasciata]|uniref:Uncharacterized protein n=1 Tax=Candidula unifasciata TaxID=100452 RepID=A0A8S4A2N7_9EUPU|nr:unnamed protein product [Candidula unifasciata]